MTFFSAHHSPSTVNMNASEFVIGTVRLSSAASQSSIAPKLHGHMITVVVPADIVCVGM